MAESITDVAEPEEKTQTMRKTFEQDDEQIEGVETKLNYGTLAPSAPAAQIARSHKEWSSRAALSRISSTCI